MNKFCVAKSIGSSLRNGGFSSGGCNDGFYCRFTALDSDPAVVGVELINLISFLSRLKRKEIGESVRRPEGSANIVVSRLSTLHCGGKRFHELWASSAVNERYIQ